MTNGRRTPRLGLGEVRLVEESLVSLTVTPKLQTGNSSTDRPFPALSVSWHSTTPGWWPYFTRPGTGNVCIHPPRGTETRCSLEHVSHLYLTARAVHKAVHRDRPASDPLRCRGGGRVAGRVTKPKYWASAAHSRVARTQSGGSSVSPLCSRHARCASVSLAIKSCRHDAPEGCANVVGERHEPVRRITAEGGLSGRGLAVQN